MVVLERTTTPGANSLLWLATVVLLIPCATSFAPFISSARSNGITNFIITASSSPSTTTAAACSLLVATTPSALHLASKNWDEILKDDNDNDDDNNDDQDGDGRPIPPDMQYNQRNCMRQNQNFVAIREAAGKELTADLYCREPNQQVFWYIGKIARVSDVSVPQAVARQWALIETHAANLRPLDLYPFKGRLELWTCPGDSELEVAYNRADLVMEKMEKEVEGAESIKNIMIGYQGEMYEPGEEGFRTWRLEDGTAARPEIESPQADDEDGGDGENRPPTEEEMVKLQKALETQDISQLYEEQQRREGKSLD